MVGAPRCVPDMPLLTNHDGIRFVTSVEIPPLRSE